VPKELIPNWVSSLSTNLGLHTNMGYNSYSIRSFPRARSSKRRDLKQLIDVKLPRFFTRILTVKIDYLHHSLRGLSLTTCAISTSLARAFQFLTKASVRRSAGDSMRRRCQILVQGKITGD
jgi:hypothetical protein